MTQRGFTLIEMAIVIILIGLMVGGGLYATAPMLDKSRINQTNVTLDQVEYALELFVIRNSRLPCPADGSQTSSLNPATYGLELPTSGTGACTATTDKAVIPWKTLGIDETFSADGWGRRLSYWTSGMTGLSTTTSVTSATASPLPLTRTGTAFPTGTYMKVTDAVSGLAVTPDPAPANTGPNKYDQAAYVLASHGKSGWYGWNKSGSLIPPGITVNSKACNSTPGGCVAAGGTLSFVSGGPVGTYPPSASTYFDDIVRWRSPAFIIQLCGSGSCGNP